MNKQPILTRRNFVSGTALLAGAAALPSVLRAQDAPDAKTYHFNEQIQPVWTKAPLAPGEQGKDYKPTITLNGSTLPFRVVDGVKVFHLICEEVDHVFVPKTEWNGGITCLLLGLQRQRSRPDYRVCRGRPNSHLRYQ